jgi:hypothetical protein
LEPHNVKVNGRNVKHFLRRGIPVVSTQESCELPIKIENAVLERVILRSVWYLRFMCSAVGKK